MGPARSPNSERWRRLETLFYKASDMDPRDREAFLDQSCGADREMRGEVESLLASADQTLTYLQDPVDQAARDLAVESALAGKLIGPWRIVRAIGDGGMGSVYLAARADEAYEQKVAIKLMRADFGGDRDMLLRFRVERQILARLTHPNIARLLDGGVSAEGLPYLAMEFIEGAPINHYCRDRNLSIEARLRLFLTVCDAVTYAHRNLVIHRDIKPANILVTPEGITRLLDFGIARLQDPDLSTAAHTRASQRLMTPEYASPEQVRGETITTASDVYSMGVLLYELLAGKRPFRIKTDNPLEIARAVCDQTPPPPSAAGDGTGLKQVKGDLDRIVMMAMRKEPERRYASVEQFAADIESYLKGYPLLARTDSWSYRSGTFIKRHKAAVAAFALFALSLAGFGVGMGLLARRAERERQTAEREKQFMAGIFDSTTPDVARGETITARTLLDRGAQRIDRELASEPQVHASLLETIATAYRSLGLYDQSETLARRSLKLDPSVKTVELLAELYRDKGEYAKAEPLLNQVIRSRRKTYGDTSPEVAAVMGELGECFYWEAKDDEAIALLRQTLVTDRKNGPNYGASTRNYLALTLERKGDFDEARHLLEEAVEINRRVEGVDSPDYAISLHNLGSALIDRGDLFGAETKLREALAVRRKIFNPGHPDLALSLNNLGYVLLERGDWRQAAPFLNEALDINRQRLGPDHPRLAGSLNNQARVLQAKGDYAEAEAVYNHALNLLQKANASLTWPAAQITANLGLLDFDRGRYAAAEQRSREALELRRKLGGDNTPAFANSLIDVAETRVFQRDPQTAIPLLRQALIIRQQKLWPGHPAIASAQVRLGGALLADHKATEAEPLLRQAVASVTHEPFPLPDRQIAEAKQAYEKCLKSLSRPTRP